MHYLAGVTAGALRGVMSASMLRGPFASRMHTNFRLAFDQTLENATGVGAPPWTSRRHRCSPSAPPPLRSYFVAGRFGGHRAEAEAES